MLADFRQKGAGGEAPTQEHGRAAGERRAGPHHQSGAVVQRQANVQPVLLRATQAGLGGQLGACQVAPVGKHGRLRQPGGAGGEDEHGRLAERGLRGVRRVLVRLPRTGLAEVRRPVGRLGVAVRHHVIVLALFEIEVHLHLLDGSRHFAAEHALLGFGDGNAVAERPSAQVGVDEAGRDADLVERDHDGQKVDAVLHHHAGHVAAPQAGRLQRSGVTVGAGVEVLPSDGLALANDGRQPADAGGVALHRRADAVLGVQRARLHALLEGEQRGYIRQRGNDIADRHAWGLRVRFAISATIALAPNSAANLRGG